MTLTDLIPTNLKLYLIIGAVAIGAGLWSYSVYKAYSLGENEVTVQVQKATLAEKTRQEEANATAQAAANAKVAELEKTNQGLTDEREKLLAAAAKDPTAGKSCLPVASVRRLNRNSAKAPAKPATGKSGHWLHWPHGFTK